MDIGTLTGTIAIQDQFSSVFDLAITKVEHYADSFDGMVGATAIGAGVAITAIGGIVAAVTALAVEGSAVNDVTSGFERLSGGAENATEVIKAMEDASLGLERFNIK